jgi:CDP-glucose 4,6-dehydratase
MEVRRDFWRGRRVFITGHTGFKGGWLSLWLQALGARVTGYALEPNTVPSLFEVARVGEGMTSIIADVRDLGRLSRAIRDDQPEVVIHLAAQPLVRLSYQQPVETYAVNVMGTVNLLEAVRQVPSVGAVVIVTTDKCYENREWAWGYREIDCLGGRDPYSNSKSCAEMVASAYRASFFSGNSPADHCAAVATARAGNVIGGGDWCSDRLVPDVIAAFESGMTLRIRKPDAIRPWQHVLEPLRGYLALAERLHADGSNFAEGWNFGPGDEDARTVRWIVEHMARLWGDGASWVAGPGEHPHEATFLRLDSSKARSRLDWHPVMNLEAAIGTVVEWVRAMERGEDMRRVTSRQIETYQALAGVGA